MSAPSLGARTPVLFVRGQVSASDDKPLILTGFPLARPLLKGRRDALISPNKEPDMIWTSRTVVAIALAVGMTSTALGQAALGQEGAPAAAPHASALTPPKLTTFVDATYPAAAQAAHRAAGL